MLNTPMIFNTSDGFDLIGIVGSLESLEDGDIAYTKGEKVHLLTPQMISSSTSAEGVTWIASSCATGNIAAYGVFDRNTATNANSSLWFPAMNMLVENTFIEISATEEITADYLQIYAASAQERTGTTLTATLVVQASTDGTDYIDISDEFIITERSLTLSTAFVTLKNIPAGTKHLKLAMRKLLANGAEAQYTHVQNVYAFGISELCFYKKV